MKTLIIILVALLAVAAPARAQDPTPIPIPTMQFAPANQPLKVTFDHDNTIAAVDYCVIIDEVQAGDCVARDAALKDGHLEVSVPAMPPDAVVHTLRAVARNEFGQAQTDPPAQFRVGLPPLPPGVPSIQGITVNVSQTVTIVIPQQASAATLTAGGIK